MWSINTMYASQSNDHVYLQAEKLTTLGHANH